MGLPLRRHSNKLCEVILIVTQLHKSFSNESTFKASQPLKDKYFFNDDYIVNDIIQNDNNNIHNDNNNSDIISLMMFTLKIQRLNAKNNMKGVKQNNIIYFNSIDYFNYKIIIIILKVDVLKSYVV